MQEGDAQLQGLPHFFSEEERRWDFFQSGLSLHYWMLLCQGSPVVDARLVDCQYGAVSLKSTGSKAVPLDSQLMCITGDNAISFCSVAGKKQSCVKKRPSSAFEAKPSLRQRASSDRSKPESGRQVLLIFMFNALKQTPCLYRSSEQLLFTSSIPL